MRCPEISGKFDGLEVKDGNIEFDHVSFRYSGKNKKYALADIDLEISVWRYDLGSSEEPVLQDFLIQLILLSSATSQGPDKAGGRDERIQGLQAPLW